MKTLLSQRQRLLAGGIYLALLWVLYHRILNEAPGSDTGALFWFYSGALMIILGRYVVEPFFTSPADAIVNGLALLIALTSLPANDQTALYGYTWLIWYAGAVLVLATVAIAFKDATHSALHMLARIAYKLAELGGKSQIMFSAVYLLASYTFLGARDEIAFFISALALWMCITFFDVVGNFLRELSKFFRWLRSGVRDELGVAIGCENPLQYKIEVDQTKYSGPEPKYGDLVAVETKTNVGSIGMVVNRKQLLGKSWLSVYILTDAAGDIISFDLRNKKLIADPKSIFAAQNRVYVVDINSDLSESDRTVVSQNPLYAFRRSFVGYITKDSNINTISFIILRDRDATDREITEGTILKTTIYGQDTLYQVINGNTREEHLEAFDSHGFIVGVARKLGKYVAANYELESRKWMPGIYSPLFFGFEGTVTDARTAAIAQDAIGRLPETDLEIRLKDLNAIVTHNTAILGILGIGKSCLSFELIKKVVAAGVKVICVDITNQYNTPDGLHAYVGAGTISFDMPDAAKQTLKNSKDDTANLTEGNPQDSGNWRQYQQALADDVKQFLESEQMVKIYNPDLHPVSKGVAFKNTSLEDMTVAEKTRIIAERLFMHARRLGESTSARYFLVLEEAHSLVPEWNSVANDGDKNATNGTAKVILQGRKYGLGSLTITQRTANVSKSILNQCNTIFAMRVFDDTGKSFLENYIGSDYANTLPTLEERHAIAIGKGLRLKQPVIIQLNDRAHFLPAPSVAVLPEVQAVAE